MGRTAVCVACCLLFACETQVPATFPTASAHPDDERRPDGIAVDLTSEPPVGKIEADTAEKVVTLETPLGVDVALRSVRGFFDAVETEDIGAMMRVVHASALLHDTSVGTNRPIHSVTSLWRQRFRKHDFFKLASRLVYREGDVVTYRADSMHLLPITLRDATSGHHTGPTDVVLAVTIVSHSVKSQRVLGDALYFWLRPSGDGYEIYRIAEDVPL